MPETNNELERALEKATHDPAARALFYRQLLNASVWVPGQCSADNPQDLPRWQREDGTTVIPFFTSLAALQQATGGTPFFVGMPVTTLFTLAAGELLMINANLAVSKLFMPDEIRQLLADDRNTSGGHTVLEGGESVLLSAITEPPAQMITALTTLFKTLKMVRRAFLCSVKESVTDPENMLIGIEMEGDIDSIIQIIGDTAMEALAEDASIDICRVVEGDGGISHFMIAHIAPFYEKRWGSFLRDFKPLPVN
ncbi:enhanced serine sensitivity protein SseB C-terminal domain-containing protein [Enterobacteriaceae bacterium ESL0689]|nr:enhanced serine sensitivity protein SseB C-terminal domain-containing protein [Enterobacteriaceae bacterium ESL0689]